MFSWYSRVSNMLWFSVPLLIIITCWIIVHKNDNLINMKKEKIKSILRFCILLFGISTFLWNCEHEPENQIQQGNVLLTSEPVVTTTNFSELQKDVKFTSLVNKLQLEQLTDVYKSTNRTTSQQGELILISDAVKKVEQGTKVSYNILAKRAGQASNIVQNVVLQNINGESRSLLLTYTFKQTSSTNRGGHFHRVGGNDINVELDEVEVGNYPESPGGGGTRTNCYYESVLVQYSCTGTLKHPYGARCNCEIKWACTPPRQEWISMEICTNNNGVVSGNWSSLTNGNGSSGAGSSGVGQSNINVTTQSGVSVMVYESPVDYLQLLTDRLSLTTAQKDWLNEHGEGGLITKLVDLLGTTEKEQLAKKAIIALTTGTHSSIEVFLFEEQIDDSNLKQCLKSILNDLKGITNGVGFIVAKFAGNSPGFNWEVKSASLTGGTGQTKAVYDRRNKKATTTFDSDAWTDATDLSWARTILHESIHAYIVASFGVDYVQAKSNFADFFRDYSTNVYPTLNDSQHAEIVRNYVSDIANSLKEYGTNKGYNLSDRFYNDLAWGGLTHWRKRDLNGNFINDSSGNPIFEETQWFKTAFPNNSDRARIIDNINIELTKKNSNGNTRTQKGTNAGC